MSNTVRRHAFSFARILVATVHKGDAPHLVADAVSDAAYSFANNQGSINLIKDVVNACQTTPAGKPRIPAVDSLPGVILAAMGHIMATAPSAGARPAKGVAVETREIAARDYAASVRALFVASVESAEQARKDKREASKASKAAPVTVDTGDTDNGADTAPNADTAPRMLAPIAKIERAADALAALTPDELAELIAHHASTVKRAAEMLAAIEGAGALLASLVAPAKARRVRAEKIAA